MPLVNPNAESGGDWHAAGSALPAAITLSGLALSGAGFLAYAARGRSAQIFGRSEYRGSPAHRAIALTFDDGPSESTPALLDLLEAQQVPATFFQCGANIRRLPEIARQVVERGHEIGNHSDSHAAMYLRSADFILREFAGAQDTIGETLGVRARLLRAPFGTRWFGFDSMQRKLGLCGVMWTVIGRDWVLDAGRVADRVLRTVTNGGIICLHDGRELMRKPNIESTIEAARRVIPELRERGYRFCTVSELLCPTN